MKIFTVIGFYRDSRQRYADTYEAETADAAEAQAVGQLPTLVVCGVIAGSHNTTESETMVKF
jgi:hypothetical protein